MISDRLKKFIFRKLYDDLSHVEIIPFKNSIWFVDRDEKYWYFELQKDGTLWWRYQFFSEFFEMFCMVRDEFQSILAEWVEEVLNSRVDTTFTGDAFFDHQVEEVLNSRVNKTISVKWHVGNRAEEVLNSRVDTTFNCRQFVYSSVEEVLNSRIIKTSEHYFKESEIVEDVLNSKFDATSFSDSLTPRGMEEALNSRVNKTFGFNDYPIQGVEDVLKSRVDTTFNCRQIVDSSVKDVLNSRVLRTQVALYSTSVMAEGVLNSKGGELFDETIVDTVLSSLQSV